eukprot:2216047-Amphidinium_carterae.1
MKLINVNVITAESVRLPRCMHIWHASRDASPLDVIYRWCTATSRFTTKVMCLESTTSVWLYLHTSVVKQRAFKPVQKLCCVPPTTWNKGAH